MRREIATRLLGLIEAEFGTRTQFRKEMKRRGLAQHESTIVGWLPPQKRWREKPAGTAMRPVDWTAIGLPDPEVLVKICREFRWSADYILLGEGSRYLQQHRDIPELQTDLAAVISRALLPPPKGYGWLQFPAAYLQQLINSVTMDADELLQRERPILPIWRAVVRTMDAEAIAALRQIRSTELETERLSLLPEELGPKGGKKASVDS
jgi:hypothetical protein